MNRESSTQKLTIKSATTRRAAIARVRVAYELLKNCPFPEVRRACEELAVALLVLEQAQLRLPLDPPPVLKDY